MTDHPEIISLKKDNTGCGRTFGTTLKLLNVTLYELIKKIYALFRKKTYRSVKHLLGSTLGQEQDRCYALVCGSTQKLSVAWIMADFAKFAYPDQNWFAFLEAEPEQQKVTTRMLQYFDGAVQCKRKNQFDGNFGFEKKENVAGSSSFILWCTIA